MERGKIPVFDGTDFAYWKVRMEAYLLSQGSAIWEIVDTPDYVIPLVRISDEDHLKYEANNKARHILFTGVSRAELYICNT